MRPEPESDTVECDIRKVLDGGIGWSRHPLVEDSLGLERRTGMAICDSDPCKLHYSWCLSMIGAAPRSRWEFELDVTRI